MFDHSGDGESENISHFAAATYLSGIEALRKTVETSNDDVVQHLRLVDGL